MALTLAAVGMGISAILIAVWHWPMSDGPGAVAQPDATIRRAQAHVQLAKALGHTGRIPEALTHLRQAVRITPDEEEGHYHIGVFLMDATPVEAEQAFLQTLRINSENFKARNNLGLVLMRTGRLAEAEAQFTLALELNPQDTLIRDNLNLVRRHRQAQ